MSLSATHLKYLPHWTEAAADRFGGYLAVSDEEESLTYEQLHRHAGWVHQRLREAGVRKGDRVAVLMENRVEMVALLFGIARAGAVYAPINYRLSQGEVAFILQDCGATVVVVEEPYRATAQQALAESGSRAHVWSYDLKTEVGEVQMSALEVEGEDAAMLLYTSGTTSRPKGVVLTHDNLFYQAVNVVCGWGLNRYDSTLVVNPIFHAVLNVIATPLFFVGGHVRLMRSFDPARTLEILESGEVTVMFAVATSWQMLAEHPGFEQATLGNMRLVASGGMAAPRPIIEGFFAKGVDFVQSYGSTETGPSATSLYPEDARGAIGSSGLPFRLTEVSVMTDSGETVAAGQSGEIWVRGLNVASGYWKRPDETREVFRPDGWFRSGDVGHMDSVGQLYITDRKKDMIISGGENIASTEVEEVIYRHPSVAEVAVVPMPSEKWGETPRAIIVLRHGKMATPEEIIDHCRANMARFKCPGLVEFKTELPKTASGKIRKSDLRE